MNDNARDGSRGAGAANRRKHRRGASQPETVARRSRPSAAHETAPAGNVSVIVAELTAVRCRWCNDDLEHCHESLVVHATGGSQCISATCVVAHEAHHMTMQCDDVGCTCTRALPAIAESA